MKISVVIPAYNASAVIQKTLDSVLGQTTPPDEILVFDDGSTDDSAAILESYKPRVTVFRQSNQGVAHARNFLCAQARGDILAFLDADDTWHPCYLEVQKKTIERYPSAVAYFTEHENLVGYGNYEWKTRILDFPTGSELIAPKEFIKRYDKIPLSFQMSGCCVPGNVLAEIGSEPFPPSISGADDTYFHNMLPLFGPVVHTPVPLVAYRITNSSISADRLKMSLSVVSAFQLLEKHYKMHNRVALHKAFRSVFASRRRNCGKFLMGAHRILDARKQLLLAARASRSPASITKSIALYCLTHLPNSVQPQWPAGQRVLNDCNLKANVGGC